MCKNLRLHIGPGLIRSHNSHMIRVVTNPINPGPTVDGKNPAPVDMYFIPSIIYYRVSAPSQVVVWDF